MKKALLALFCLMLSLLAAGCGSSDSASAQPAAAERGAAVSGPAAERTEPVNIKWWTFCSMDAPTDAAEVLAKANEISAEKIGVTVDLTFKTQEQLELDLNAGRDYDMIFTCSWCNNFDKNARYGYYYDLTDLLKEQPGLYEAVDPWWSPATLNGRIYGIPALKDLGAEVFFRLNSDYYEVEKGLTLPEEMKFEELEPLLAMWKADHPGEYPLHMAQNGLSGMSQVHENIVSNYLVIPYDRAGTPDGTKIVPVWESDKYMGMLRCLHRWYELGYINPDAATTTELPYSLLTPVRSGTAWTGYRGWSNPETVGFNVKLVRYIGPNMSRVTMQGALFAINAAATPETAKACLDYMELLYTDKSFRDLLAYGIEGKHFNYYEGTVIRTPEGADGYSFDTYVTGPVVSASVVSASDKLLADSDQWEKVYAGYENVVQSDTNGFSYDGSATESERAVLETIWQNWFNRLITGTADPDEAMASMKTEMEKAGLNTVLQDAQQQLDAFLSAK